MIEPGVFSVEPSAIAGPALRLDLSGQAAALREHGADTVVNDLGERLEAR